MIQLSYLVATSLFIVGLQELGSPETARRGNALAALGMGIAVVATLFLPGVYNFYGIAFGIIIGSAIGILVARMIKMTAMPQLVGLLNGFGGAASTLVSIAEYMDGGGTVMIFAGILIGAITFTGSVVAFAKLQGLIRGSPITFPFQQGVNALLAIGFLVGTGYLILHGNDPKLFMTLIAISLVLGVLFVIPIGGADMPVVISLLNSFSGVAASAAGFIVNNNLLIISGALVGASGLILTRIMCRAMNRSLTNVLFGAVGVTTGDTASTSTAKSARSVDPAEAAMILAYAKKVIIVPGFGMAAAQAQHAVRELADLLEKRGVDVKYAIHPVAGRMPGHMNVLLAEADVPYTQLSDMDEINPEFERTDVAVVIGANDVVNPAARHATGSPIYGMPILNVDHAHHIIVIKRSLGAGFAGIDNELFYHEKTMMCFGSAKDIAQRISSEIKQL